ncbi:sulfate permease [Phytomonospora endophytica]|nr:sulfate permease [Phytomonospora endophytica]
MSGLVTGLFSIPEGMAYASVGGFSPVLGLYSGMFPAIIGSFFARTVLMVTTLTSALALSSQSVLAEAGLDPADLGNVATLTVLVGLMMILFGVLRLGSIMNFVSSAVMTGFTTGIAVQILTGVLGDATGYEPRVHNKVAQAADWLVHVTDWDPSTTALAAGTVVVWFAARSWARIRTLAMLIALIAATVAAPVFSLDVETVGDIASIPASLPVPVLPELSVVPELLVGAVAVTLVALAQAAGIAAAVPNPDGSRTSASGDFVAQGLANVAGGFLRSLPVGGSLSRTGVATDAGARTRWAGIFAGLWLTAVVLVAGRFAEYIPMPVIGGLMLIVGAELIVGQARHVRLVLRTSRLSTAAMAVTFLATTQIPLQQAIFLGALLSLVFYCVQAARRAKLVALRSDGGGWRVADPPEVLPARQVTVLHYAGSGFFAGFGSVGEQWPRTDGAAPAVLILSVRTLTDIPSATVLEGLARRAEELRASGSLLMLAGLDARFRKILDDSGVLARVGADNVFEADDEVFGALDRAAHAAHVWIAGHRRTE